jgi:hypothetical protein
MILNRQIIALGGGGFSMELGNPVLDRYILQQVDQQSMLALSVQCGDFDRTCGFIPPLDDCCLGTCLIQLKPRLRAYLNSQIYCLGGNTKSMLCLRRLGQMCEAWASM